MTVDPRTGLFSSSLVPQETSPYGHETKERRRRPLTQTEKDFEQRAAREAFRIQPASDVEAAFRHSRWTDTRERVRDALMAANVPVARVERFNACGSNCIVEYSPSTQKHRVRATYCHDRFCEPCARSRAKKVAQNLTEWCQGETVRFITFTLRQTEQPLHDVLSRLLTCFTKIRQWKFWKKSVDAGAAVVEITRGARGDHWHVHLHVLVLGAFIDQKELSDAWLAVTGDSKIVDVRAVRDSSKAVGYVAKYATKGWSESVVSDTDALLECILALRGRRLLITFGRWYDRDDQLCKVGPDDWKRVGRLDVIFADAVAGQPYAIAVFRSMCIAAGRVGVVPTFVGCDPPFTG